MPGIDGLRACMDVPDVERAIQFYTRGIGLEVGRRFDAGWIELVGGPIPIDLRDGTRRRRRTLWRALPAATIDVTGLPSTSTSRFRTSMRPSRGRAAGATVEGELGSYAWGRIARLADPAGHGFCLLEFRGRGYDGLSPGE